VDEPVTARAREVVLCLNCGSSSLRYALFDVDGAAPVAIKRGSVDGVAHGEHASAFDAMFKALRESGAPSPTMVGHRVVHGGVAHVKPERIDDALLEHLGTLVPLAPLHLPAAISGIEATRKRYPALPQVACFDTAFHAGMPEVARRLPLPSRFDEEGIRRFGFHGLSYEYVMGTLGDPSPARVIIAHLGSGASLVAVEDGRAIDTTMGFTPTGGIMMGTRSGDLDPGTLAYLLREQKVDVATLERMIERESGLLAVGGTADMKTLLSRADQDPRAKLAVQMFSYAVKKAIGGFVAALGGLDVLAFTGAIGEHAAEVRRQACEGLEAMGIALDAERNQRSDDVISANASRVSVRVARTEEDLVVAKHAKRVLGAR